MTYPMRTEALGIIESDSVGVHWGSVKVVRGLPVWYLRVHVNRKP